MIIKPDFYDKFECIAGECDFTCCKEWKIAVDDATASKWKNMIVCVRWMGLFAGMRKSTAANTGAIFSA